MVYFSKNTEKGEECGYEKGAWQDHDRASGGDIAGIMVSAGAGTAQ